MPVLEWESQRIAAWTAEIPKTSEVNRVNKKPYNFELIKKNRTTVWLLFRVKIFSFLFFLKSQVPLRYENVVCFPPPFLCINMYAWVELRRTLTGRNRNITPSPFEKNTHTDTSLTFARVKTRKSLKARFKIKKSQQKEVIWSKSEKKFSWISLYFFDSFRFLAPTLPSTFCFSLSALS